MDSIYCLLVVAKLTTPPKTEYLILYSNISLWDNPDKYLGVPPEWGGSKVHGLFWLKEKVLAKMEGWKGNLPNQARKEVLIKAVIQAIHNYIMSILTLPKIFCASLAIVVANFLWKFSRKYRGIHWKNFEILCSPKSLRGWVLANLTRWTLLCWQSRLGELSRFLLHTGMLLWKVFTSLTWIFAYWPN